MGLTRDQVKSVNDITYESLFVPEWLDGADTNRLSEIDAALAELNGHDPSLSEKLTAEQQALREKATAYVWRLSAFECTQLQQDTRENLGPNKQQNERNFFAYLAVMTVRDQSGVPVFTKSDIPWLAKKSFRALNRIASHALKINGLTKQDQDELLKN